MRPIAKPDCCLEYVSLNLIEVPQSFSNELYVLRYCQKLYLLDRYTHIPFFPSRFPRSAIMRQALVCGLLTFALAQANPTIKSPSRLAKRGGPNPSHYPGKDTPECANEPLYLNFDISQKTDKDRVQKIHDVFCNEVDLLMIAGQTATQDQDRTLYKRYLPENDDEDKYEAFTEDIWNKLFDFNAQTPSKLVSTFIIDNKDWKGSCPESGGTDLIDDSDTLDEAAYTGVDKEDNDREKTHICAAALEYIPLADITCDTLDSYPSVQMESAGRLMLHEFLHYSTVGPDSLRKFWKPTLGIED